MRRWLEAWRPFESEPVLALQLRLMNTAARYRETLDDAVLLELPMEQREMLRPHVERHLQAIGRAVHPVDTLIDDLVQAVRAQRAQRNTRILDRKLPPLNVDTILQGYSARQRIVEPLPRLVDGRWRAISAGDAAALLTRLKDALDSHVTLQDKERAAMRVLRIDRTPLTFSSRRLHQAHIEINGRLGALDFLADAESALLLSGDSWSIHEFFGKAKHDFVVSAANEIDYIRFFCSAIRGGDVSSRFRMPHGESPASRRAITTRLSELKLKLPPPQREIVDGKTHFIEAALYDDQFFEVRLVRNSSEFETTVEMLEDRMLTPESLGLPCEEFVGAIRFWRKADTASESVRPRDPVPQPKRLSSRTKSRIGTKLR
jgi:hypothetical protein